MRFLRYDSPVMMFISKVADFVILNLLWLLCSIPVFTLGAATSAKYYVAMKIVRQEDSGVIKPFFSAFKDNFKQATVIWLVLLGISAVIGIDWIWIIYTKGLGNVPSYYLIGLSIFSVLVLCICMNVFAFIARFTVTTGEAIKAGVIFALLHIIRMTLIALIEIGTVVACIWYYQWVPLIAVFGTTTALYFNTILLVKEYKKMEDNYAKQQEEAQDEDAEFKEEETIFHDSVEEVEENV